MPQSLFKMLAHIVFSTKNRADLIAPEIENGLFGYMHGIAENNGAKLIIGAARQITFICLFPCQRKLIFLS